MNDKRKHFSNLKMARRFPCRNWIIGWMILSLVMSPIVPGSHMMTLPLSQVLQASGEDTSLAGGDDYIADMPDIANMPDTANMPDIADMPDTADMPVEYDPSLEEFASGMPLDSDGDGISDEDEALGIDVMVPYWVDDGYDEASGTIIGHWEVVLLTVMTDPFNRDTDGDRLPDGWEATMGLDPTNPADGLRDDDSDGLSLGEEYEWGTNWLDPDTDGDGLLDGDEVKLFGSDPNNPNDPGPEPEENSPTEEGGGPGKSSDEPGAGTSIESTPSSVSSPSKTAGPKSKPKANDIVGGGDTPSLSKALDLKFEIGVIGANSSNFLDLGSEGDVVDQGDPVGQAQGEGGATEVAENIIENEVSPDRIPLQQVPWMVDGATEETGVSEYQYGGPSSLRWEATSKSAKAAIESLSKMSYKKGAMLVNADKLVEMAGAGSYYEAPKKGDHLLRAAWRSVAYQSASPLASTTQMTCVIKVVKTPIEDNSAGADEGEEGGASAEEGGMESGGLKTGGLKTGGLKTGGLKTGGLVTGGLVTGGLKTGTTKTGTTKTGTLQTGGAETSVAAEGGAGAEKAKAVPLEGVEELLGTAVFTILKGQTKARVKLVMSEGATADVQVDESGRLLLLQPEVKENEEHKVIVVPVEIIPDYNRDGVIDDRDRGRVSEENPWRWWVNDDDDSGEFDASGADTPGAGSRGDYKDAKVDGIRDLVDFFPLHLDLKVALKSFPASEYQYFLKQKKSNLGISLGALWYSAADPDKDPSLSSSVGGFLRNLRQAFDVAANSIEEIDSKGIPIPKDLLDAAAKGKGAVFIEGKTINFDPLVIEIRSRIGGNSAEVEFPIRISHVEDMYRHVDLRTVPKKRDGTSAGYESSSLPSRTKDPGHSYPDTLTNGKYFVFIHGFAVNEKQARGWNAEIFKRLHQMGSRARFVGISWSGDTGIPNFPDIRDANFHKAIFNAFQTGDVMRNALAFTGSADVTIAAHSLGNIAMSHAIADAGFSPNRYYLLNAAVAIEAYNSQGIPRSQKYAMTEKKWKRYFDATGDLTPKVFAARWYQLFDEDDKRSELAWVNRFAKVNQIAYNFYSPGDDVVQNPDPGVDTAFLFDNGFWNTSKGRGAWHSQEFAKGSTFLATKVQEWKQAGWGFANRYVVKPPIDIGYSMSFPPKPSVVAKLSSEDLRKKPIFMDFLEKDLFDPAIGSGLAERKFIKYQTLAGGIPALSFAAAANKVEGVRGNFNMQKSFRTDKNQWPREGHEDNKSKGDWIHSDFYGVALPHIYQLYDKMINLGGLNE